MKFRDSVSMRNALVVCGGMEIEDPTVIDPKRKRKVTRKTFSVVCFFEREYLHSHASYGGSVNIYATDFSFRNLSFPGRSHVALHSEEQKPDGS